jgi:hypothetical protein
VARGGSAMPRPQAIVSLRRGTGRDFFQWRSISGLAVVGDFVCACVRDCRFPDARDRRVGTAAPHGADWRADHLHYRKRRARRSREGSRARCRRLSDQTIGRRCIDQRCANNARLPSLAGRLTGQPLNARSKLEPILLRPGWATGTMLAVAWLSLRGRPFCWFLRLGRSR